MAARSSRNRKTQKPAPQEVAPPKRGRGRPKKGGGVEKISCSLPIGELAWLRTWAAGQDEKLSEVIRQAVVEFRDRYS